MSELTITVIRLGFLAVLWLFVLTAISVMRSDLFGVRPTGMRPVVPVAAPRTPKPIKIPKSRRGAPSKVVVTHGELSGTIIALTEAQVTVGRASDSTLVLEDDYASNRHARLYQSNGEWLVEDLGSTNGTYLDRERVLGPTPAQLGVPIRIGKTVFELRK
ncbi:MAG: FHA domain-containing protein FhaB/FipA [Sporichthyaceae bacterium]